MEQTPKKQASALLKETPPYKITLVYLLLALVLPFVVQLFVPDVFSTLSIALAAGNQQAAINALNQGGGSALFLSLLLMLFGWVLKFGYSQWALSTARSQPTQYSTLLEGFGISGRVVVLYLFKFANYYLWMLAMITLNLVVFLLPLSMIGVEFLAIPYGFICGIFALGFVTIRYGFSLFALVDHPEKGPFSALRNSVLLTRKRYKSILKVYLSFWPWFLGWTAISMGLNLAFLYPVLAYLLEVGTAVDQDTLTTLLLTEPNPLFYWLGLFASWGFTFFFLPRFQLAMALLYDHYVKEGPILPFPVQDQ